MINIQTQVDYWHDNATEDWQVACDLLDQGRVRHSLFFAHLGLEKIAKSSSLPTHSGFGAATA
jgi:hypothetical protein